MARGDEIELVEGNGGVWEHVEPEAVEDPDDPGQPELFPAPRSDDESISRYYVYKRNELIHGSYTLSTFGLKTLSVLISRIDPRATDGEMPAFEMSVIEFARLMGVSRQRVYEVIEQVTDELQSQFARLPLRDFEYEKAVLKERADARAEGREIRAIARPKPDPRSFIKVSWFDYSRYDQNTGKISFAFHRDMAPYLRDFSGFFTKYSPQAVLGMRSFYSIRLYEIFRSFLSLKSIQSGTREIFRTISYAELRNLLDLGDKYPRLSSFETRVLRQAQKELASTDLTFEYSFPERKTPRSRAKVTRIRFHIRSLATPGPESQVSEASGSYALPAEIRADLVKQYGEDQVSRNLIYVAGEIAGGFQPAHPDRFAISCIRKDIEATGGALNPFAYTDSAQRAFVSERLSKMWDTLPAESRAEFVEHRFRKGLVAQMYQQYARETQQRSVSATIMDDLQHADTDW